MRKEAREERTVNIAQVAGYHHGNNQYEKHLVFASDRPNEADATYHLMKDGSLPAMIGIELETECWGITNSTIYANLLRDVVFKVFPANLWKIESDCTLGGGDVGAECITQPMTKAFIRNHYRDFKAMYEYFRSFGIDASRSGNCGQHAHISLTCFGRTKAAQDARDYVAGNGDIIAVQDVSDQYRINASRIYDALEKANFTQHEIDYIVRTLQRTEIAR